MKESFEKNKSQSSVLESLQDQLALARKLENVYTNRPNLDSFVGAISDLKFKDEYTAEVIEKDKNYVKEKRSRINETNSSFGRENLDNLEKDFQFSEIMQAMVVDRMNKKWFKDCKAIMTSDYDDLRVGIDAVMKHKDGTYLGAAFDFTVTNKEKIIYEKLKKEWNFNIKDGKIHKVKYFEDPDTKKKSPLLVPKFIISASAKEVEELARAYLNDDNNTLENHPFKYIMLLQIEEQLQTALDYFETNPHNEKLNFSKQQYINIQTILRGMKQEIHLDEKMREVDLYEYSKENIGLGMIRRFRIAKDQNSHSVDSETQVGV